MAPDRLIALVDALLGAQVEFVVIGGLAAVLRGAPLVTADIDLVHRRTPANVARLLPVLLGFHARARADSRNLPPTESALMRRGHILLDSDLGPIDVLWGIGKPMGSRTRHPLARRMLFAASRPPAVRGRTGRSVYG